MTVHQLRALVGDDFEAVNALIMDRIQSEVSLIDKLSTHIFSSGGKRIRPLLVLLASRACGYEGTQHIVLAAMIEFFHTASLLHDDVVDESALRRGTETAHNIWGSKASILVGDYLLTLYMQLMLDVGNMDIMKLLINMSHQVACGEIRQLANRHKITLSEADYFDVIRSKTALLFAASACISGMLSGLSESDYQCLFDYGLHLGNAFQLIDDALDYCSDKATMGKNIGDDLADGKVTLPLLHVLKEGTLEQQEQIKISIEEGTLIHLPAILEAIVETKAIEYTQRVADSEVQRAIDALVILPDSVYKDGLITLARYAGQRDH